MIRVTCAIIEQHHRVLVTQRSINMSQPLLWEFPGGKVEPDENDEACLIREIIEELSIEVVPVSRLSPVAYTYKADLVIELIPFICHYKHGNVVLHDHRAYQWAALSDMKSYNWCPADIPIVEEYLKFRQHTLR